MKTVDYKYKDTCCASKLCKRSRKLRELTWTLTVTSAAEAAAALFSFIWGSPAQIWSTHWDASQRAVAASPSARVNHLAMKGDRWPWMAPQWIFLFYFISFPWIWWHSPIIYDWFHYQWQHCEVKSLVPQAFTSLWTFHGPPIRKITLSSAWMTSANLLPPVLRTFYRSTIESILNSSLSVAATQPQTRSPPREWWGQQRL